MPFLTCPAKPEEIAEAYVMDALAPDDVTAFEDHYLTCAACAATVQDASHYIEAMRTAAQEVREQKPLTVGHGAS